MGRSQKNNRIGNVQFLSGCRFVQNIAPPLLSRDTDRGITMVQTSKNKLGDFLTQAAD